MCKSSTSPECLQPSSCHLGCKHPMVPTLPTPGGGGIWAILGNPGEKQMKLQISDTPKNGLHKRAYAGHMPGILGGRSRDQAYAGHICDTGNGKRGKYGAYAAHMLSIYLEYEHMPGICSAYAHRHMPNICRIYARFQQTGEGRGFAPSRHMPGICRVTEYGVDGPFSAIGICSAYLAPQ